MSANHGQQWNQSTKKDRRQLRKACQGEQECTWQCERKKDGVSQGQRRGPTSEKSRSTRSAMLSQSRGENDIINSRNRENTLAVRFEGGKVSRGFDGQRSEKSMFRVKAMRELSNGTIAVSTNGNFAMPVVEHKLVQILSTGRAFISLGKIDSNEVDPFTLEVNGNGKNKAFIDPRKQKVRKGTIPESKEIRNKKSNPRMPRIGLKFLPVKAFKRARTHRQMKASLRGLPRGHRGL